MARRAVCRVIGAALVLMVLSACNRQDAIDARPADAGARPGPSDSDAGAEPIDAARPPVDASGLDAAAGRPARPPLILPNTQCALAVGAECDGREDCPIGQTCCGHYEPVFFTYSSIECRSRCDDSNDIEFCHPGQTCMRAGHVCRASLIIPYDFIGVCALPSSSVPPLKGEAVAGDVACADASCSAASEQCCLRSRYDFNAMSLSALEPYCAPLEHTCSCDHDPTPPDAGVPDAGGDEDAG
jgi:hypothetical protein